MPNVLEQIGDVCTKVNLSYELFAKRHGISDNELAILYTLWIHDATQKHIADKYHLAKQTIHTLCKKYEGDGMILVQNNDNDKREKIMSLTDKGKDFAKPIIENLLNQENQVIRQFGEQRMAFLLSELSQLQQALSDQFEQNDAE